jgi:phosphoglycolate phosphatase-like HAD superfamily hydrolase
VFSFSVDSKQLRSIAFDFDLTIADTKNAIVSTLVQTFQVLGKTPKFDIALNFELLKSLKLKEQIKLLLDDEGDLQSLNRIISRYMELYRLDGIKKTVLFPGVVELFDFLHKADFEIHIVSAKSQKNLDYSIVYTNLKADKIIGNVSGQEKSEYLQKFRCATYVGDAEIDVDVARNAKCLSIILNSNVKEINTWQIPPDFHFESVRDFYAWVRSSENLELVRFGSADTN